MNWSYTAERNAKEYPDIEAIISEDHRITYRQFNERVNAIAKGLLDSGVEREDRVAILLYNCPEYAELTFAINKVGGIWVPINWRLVREELAYILNDCGAKLIISEMDFREALTSIKDRIPLVKQYIGVGRDIPADWASYDDIVERNSDIEVPHTNVEWDDIQRIMYTSGTTAHPKGAMITYGNLYWKNMAHIIAKKMAYDDRYMVVGPMYHVGGMDFPMTTLMYLGGTTGVILRRFDIIKILDTIQKEKINHLFLAPSMINMVLQEPTFDNYDLSSLKWIAGGGEKMPIPLLEKFTQKFPPGIYFFGGSGLTELVDGCTTFPWNKSIIFKKPDSVGKPLLGLRLRIVDDEGNDVPQGQLGEIVYRGPQVFKGYWKNEQATAEAIKNGWFHTGDIGYLDEDDFLYIVDRKKDMIKSGGENIASAEVERVIHELPQVFDTAVISIPHPKWLEVPKAFIVLKKGQRLSEQDVVDHCTRKLAKFKVPKEIEFASELPRLPSGKVLKRELKRQEAEKKEHS